MNCLRLSLLFIVVCSVIDLRFLMMGLNSFTQTSWFIVFGCFMLGLFVFLALWIKFLHSRNGFVPNSKHIIQISNDLDGFCSDHEAGLKFKSVKRGNSMEEEEDGIKPLIDSQEKNVVKGNEGCDENDVVQENFDVDKVFDVVSLRKMVKKERKRSIDVSAELDKERMASASAADEAMAMILRLQSEKSSMEIEANHYKRMVEQKREYEQDLIQSWQWTIDKHEADKNLLEDRLKYCMQILRMHFGDDEIDQLENMDFSLNHWSSAMDDENEETMI